MKCESPDIYYILYYIHAILFGNYRYIVIINKDKFRNICFGNNRVRPYVSVFIME